MAKRARHFSDLSKAAQERALRIGYERYDLSREQVRRRYNAGTWNPYARGNPRLRIPTEFRKELDPDTFEPDWEELAKRNMTRAFGPGAPTGERYKWNEFQVETSLAYASDKVLRVMASATVGELEELAFVQSPSESVALPRGLNMEDIGYYITGPKSGVPEWINIFWYH
jgi:hypothetical protein